MRSLTTTFSLLIIASNVYAQTSWVQPMEHQGATWGYYDFACGLADASNSPDGTVYLLGKYHDSRHRALIKYDWVNQDTIWTRSMGGKCGAACTDYCDFVRATADSGCISAINTFPLSGNYASTIIKFSKSGAVQWTNSLNYPFPGARTIDIIQKSNGHYYVVIYNLSDSIFEYDHNGNITWAATLPTQTGNRNIYEIPGGDLLVRHSSSVYRWTFSNTLWTLPVSTDEMISFTSNFIFLCDTNQAASLSVVRKVNVGTGAVVWQDTVNHGLVNSIYGTIDGGVILSVGRGLDEGFNFSGPPPDTLTGSLVKMDATGNIQWDNSYGFGEYGLSHVSELIPGYYLTGGTYYSVNIDNLQLFAPNGFIATIDSSGNGLLQETSYTWPGDANQNDTIWMVEDILYTALAWGSTGPVSTVPPPPIVIPPSTWWWTRNSFAFDWPGQFGNGVNFKHSDFDNSGIIDMADIQNYFIPLFALFYPRDVKNLRKTYAPPSSMNPDLNFLPEMDTVAPGGIMRFYIVPGNTGAPFDSICGLDFHVEFPSTLTDTTVFNTFFYNNTLGDTAFNYLTFTHKLPDQFVALFSRTDQQNSYQFSDTIGYIELKVNPSISSVQLFDYSTISAFAATADGHPVQFDFITSPVVIDPSLVGIEKNIDRNNITAYPNPANQELIISGAPLHSSIGIYDALGRNVCTRKLLTEKFKLNTSILRNGIYLVRVLSPSGTKIIKAAIYH